MNKEIIKSSLDEGRAALSDLNAAISLIKKTDIDNISASLFHDAMIKRFEILFNKIIRLLRFSLLEEGIETTSPRQIIQESTKLNWINDIDFWAISLDAKTLSMSELNDLTKQEFENIIAQFATEAEVVINLIKELKLKD